MRSRILAALALSAVAAFAQQVKVESGPIPPLAELIPADVIAYVRLEDPVNDFEKLMGSGDTWKSPQKSAARTRRAMDKGFKEADRNAGVEEGSMDSWMRSIGSIEVALFTLNWEGDEGLADSPPVPDLVAVFESSLAVEMYNEVSAMLVDRGMATRSERGDLVLGLGEAFSPTLAIYGNKVVLATTPERLDSVLKAAKGGATNTLAQSATFRATCGDGRGPRVGYMRFGALLELIRDRLSERTRKQMNDVIQPLGLTKIAGIGYREDGPNGVITAKADGPVTAFQLLKSKAGPPGLAAGMPADTGFCVSWSGDVGPHLRRIETFLTDKAQFPFAPTVGMGVRWLTGRLGVGTDVLLDPLKNGLVFGMVPDGAGRTSERNLVLVAGLDPADANDYIAAVRRAYEKSSKQETEESTVDGVRWIREKAAPPKEAREGFASTGDGGARAPASRPAAAGGGDDDEEQVVEVRISAGSDTRPSATTTRRARPRTERLRRSDPFVLTYDGKLLVIGGEEAVRRTRASLLGQAPTLGGTPAFQRLPQQAQTYTAFTLKSMFADGSEFGAAFGLLKDLGSIGAATTVEDDRVTVTYNRAPGQFIGMMIGAAAIGEDARDETAKVRDALAEIARKTNEFAQQHKKWPASLADLGYGGGKTPTFPDEDGKPKAIVFLPPKVAVGEGGYGDLLAYWDCSDYGRLAVDLSGYASTWSESRFLTAFAQYNTPK